MACNGYGTQKNTINLRSALEINKRIDYWANRVQSGYIEANASAEFCTLAIRNIYVILLASAQREYYNMQTRDEQTFLTEVQ